MAGYTRQQSYIDGDTILAEHSNDEFNLLQEVFDKEIGHSHDGTEGSGGAITRISDKDLDTYIAMEENADEDKMHFYTGGAKKMTIDAFGLLIGDRFRISYNAALDTLDIGVE